MNLVDSSNKKSKNKNNKQRWVYCFFSHIPSLMVGLMLGPW
jgi:hypothetical protein